jgi:hypothetical protein
LNSAGCVYIADHNNHRIRKVTPDGTIPRQPTADSRQHRNGNPRQCQ